MSDHDDFGTAELDSAFERLAASIDSQTRPRGAERAIRSAVRRRVLAAGAFAAAVVLAWVLMGALVLPVNHTAPPVTTTTFAPLPAPRAFDTAAFNEATQGWISGWIEAAPPVSTQMACNPYDGPLPQPLESSTTEFRAGNRGRRNAQGRSVRQRRRCRRLSRWTDMVRPVPGQSLPATGRVVERW